MLKRFFHKKLAFTLTELLIALTIIGAIAGMSIPNLMEGIHKRTMAAQAKNIYNSLQEIAREQLSVKKTKNLLDTDFGDPSKLLTDDNFHIARKCNTANECWNKEYKTLSNKKSTRVAEGNPKTIILKNGQILSYQQSILEYKIDGGKDRAIGLFYVDVNGTEKPNIIGRDVFWFYISEKGKVVDQYTATNTFYSRSQALANCKTESTITGCLSLLMRNNWVMDY